MIICGLTWYSDRLTDKKPSKYKGRAVIFDLSWKILRGAGFGGFLAIIPSLVCGLFQLYPVSDKMRSPLCARKGQLFKEEVPAKSLNHQ